MPRSKREKIVPLTKTKQARKELKSGLVDSIREAVDKYAYAFVFSFENMRTGRFKELRAEWADSRFFLGKNKVMQLALGTDGESAYRPGLEALAADVGGNVGLLLTDRTPAEVREFFEGFGEPDYARAGFVPSETITVKAGALSELPHTMADQLRKLGMGVRLEKGVVTLPADYSLCTEGKPLTPEQGRLLKLFGHQLAVFRIHLLSVWKKEGGGYEPLALESSYARVAAQRGFATDKPARTAKNRRRGGGSSAGAAAGGGGGADEEDGSEEEEEMGGGDSEDEDEDS